MYLPKCILETHWQASGDLTACAVRMHRTPAGKSRPATVVPAVMWSLAGKPSRHNTFGGLLHRPPGRALSGGQELCEDARVPMPWCSLGLRSCGRLRLLHGGALGHEVDCQVAAGSRGICVTEPSADNHWIDLRLQRLRRLDVTQLGARA